MSSCALAPSQSRRLLESGVGILKAAKLSGIGTGTAQKLKREMATAG